VPIPNTPPTVVDDLTDPRLHWDSMQSEFENAETEFAPIEAEARRSLELLNGDLETTNPIDRREEP
jgi:hypothetical protein